MQDMGAGASASRDHQNTPPSPNSILSAPIARQRTSSTTHSTNGPSLMQPSSVIGNSTSQVSSGPHQGISSNLFLHRSNPLQSHTSHSNAQSTISSSPFVLDMPVGDLSTSSSAGERLPSQRVDHHLPAALVGTLLNNNMENERRDTGMLSTGPNGAARRLSERIARLTSSGNRNSPRLVSSLDEEMGRNLPEGDSRRGEQQGNIDGGNTSPMGFFAQLIHQNPELSGVIKATEKYIPFLLIAAAKGFFDHATGIFVFIALIVTFFHANSVITREISRHARRNIWPLIAVLVNLLACIIFIHFVFEDAKLYLLTIFLPSGKVETFSELLWIVAVNDFILKFVAVIFKILIVMLPGNLLAFRKRGNCFLFIEMTSQMHRSLVPIQVWLTYLLEGGLPGGTGTDKRIPAKVIGVILTAMYMVVKGRLILKDAMAWKTAAARFWQNTQYGMSPSVEELKVCGGVCPICHDSLQEPTILHCKHVFCEECVATWFDRERTCPMCRAQITEDPAWRDGSTSQFIQLF